MLLLNVESQGQRDVCKIAKGKGQEAAEIKRKNIYTATEDEHCHQLPWPHVGSGDGLEFRQDLEVLIQSRGGTM